jgi:hypothetical protein
MRNWGRGCIGWLWRRRGASHDKKCQHRRSGNSYSQQEIGVALHELPHPAHHFGASIRSRSLAQPSHFLFHDALVQLLEEGLWLSKRLSCG